MQENQYGEEEKIPEGRKSVIFTEQNGNTNVDEFEISNQEIDIDHDKDGQSVKENRLSSAVSKSQGHPAIEVSRQGTSTSIHLPATRLETNLFLNLSRAASHNQMDYTSNIQDVVSAATMVSNTKLKCLPLSTQTSQPPMVEKEFSFSDYDIEKDGEFSGRKVYFS